MSAPGFPAESLKRSAETISSMLLEIGMRNVQIFEMSGAHPAVFGEFPAPPGAPTVLLYAHHDVQPAGSISKWESDPFDPVIRDGKMFGRGVSDDKAGIIVHLAAIDAFEGNLPVGVKVFVEGEEEIGSTNLAGFVDRNRERMDADVIVIGDSQNWSTDRPALTVSLRGTVAVKVDVTTAKTGVHSGQFGGVFPDALTALAHLMTTLHHPDGSVAVKGLAETEADDLDLTADDLRNTMGTVPGLRELGTGSVTSRLWAKPAISILALDAPPISETINQLVPSAAAKVSMRTAPGQDTEAAFQALTEHLLSNAPWGAQVEVTRLEHASPFSVPSNGPVPQAFAGAMTQAWGVEPAYIGMGGSIPFVADIAARFPESAIVLTGPGDPTSAIHAPNENQDLQELEKCILAEALALEALGRISI